MGNLIFAVLDERHSFPEWMRQAKAAKWEPPKRWYKEERKAIHKVASTLLHDRHVLSVGVDWKLQRRDEPCEMEIIAEQAS